MKNKSILGSRAFWQIGYMCKVQVRMVPQWVTRVRQMYIWVFIFSFNHSFSVLMLCFAYLFVYGRVPKAKANYQIMQRKFDQEYLFQLKKKCFLKGKSDSQPIPTFYITFQTFYRFMHLTTFSYCIISSLYPLINTFFPKQNLFCRKEFQKPHISPILYPNKPVSKNKV